MQWSSDFYYTFSIIITILSVKYHIKQNSDIRLIRKKNVCVSIMPLIYDLWALVCIGLQQLCKNINPQPPPPLPVSEVGMDRYNLASLLNYCCAGFPDLKSNQWMVYSLWSDPMIGLYVISRLTHISWFNHRFKFNHFLINLRVPQLVFKSADQLLVECDTFYWIQELKCKLIFWFDCRNKWRIKYYLAYL